MICGLETGIMEGSGFLTATLCPRPVSSYLAEYPEANRNLSFYQDNPKVITVRDSAFGGVILQYTYSRSSYHFHHTSNIQGQNLCFLTFSTATVPHKQTPFIQVMPAVLKWLFTLTLLSDYSHSQKVLPIQEIFIWKYCINTHFCADLFAFFTCHA